MGDSERGARTGAGALIAAGALLAGAAVGLELLGLGKPGFGQKQVLLLVLGLVALALGLLRRFDVSLTKLAVALGSVLGTLLVVALVAELLLGDDSEYKPGRWRAIRLREWPPGARLLPRPGRMELSDSLEQKEYPLRIDENGFIIPSAVHEAPEHVIVFLGGSTTECMMVGEENRFPARVGTLLSERIGPTNAYNAGKAGNSTLHSIDVLLNKVIPMRPDVVVMMHNVNDLSPLMFGESNWTTDIPGRNVIQHFNSKKPLSEVAWDGLQSVFPNLTTWIEQVTAPQDEFAKLRRTKSIQVDREFLRTEFTSSLRAFVEICRAWEITPVLATQASRLKPEPDELVLQAVDRIMGQFDVDYAGYRDLHRWFNDIIREVAAEKGVQLVDLAESVPQEKEYLYDLYHMNDRGSLFVADRLAEALEPILRGGG